MYIYIIKYIYIYVDISSTCWTALINWTALFNHAWLPSASQNGLGAIVFSNRPSCPVQVSRCAPNRPSCRRWWRLFSSCPSSRQTPHGPKPEPIQRMHVNHEPWNMNPSSITLFVQGRNLESVRIQKHQAAVSDQLSHMIYASSLLPPVEKTAGMLPRCKILHEEV